MIGVPGNKRALYGEFLHEVFCKSKRYKGEFIRIFKIYLIKQEETTSIKGSFSFENALRIMKMNGVPNMQNRYRET